MKISKESASSRSLRSSWQIGVRLALAFSLLVALLIAVGDLGLRRIDHIHDDLQGIMDRQWAKVRLTREAASFSSGNIGITLEIFLLKNRQEIDALLANHAENRAKVSAALSDLEKQCDSGEERRLLEVIRETRRVYLESYFHAVNLLVKENNRDAAASELVRQSIPALLQYHAAWDEFVRFQDDQIELAARDSGARYTAARHIALIMIIAAVVIAGVTAMSVIRRMLREITDRLREEKDALREAHDEAEVFINAVPSILIGVDRSSRITRWNRAAASAFGLSEPEVVGKPLASCGVQWQRSNMEEEVRAWCEENKSRRCDLVSFQMKGETRLLGLTITPIHMADENAELLVIGSDVTDRAVLEDQLRQAQKLESVGQLAAGIAHEINTPTQYIGDNVSFLKDAFEELKALLFRYEGFSIAAKQNVPSREAIQTFTAEVENSNAAYLLEEIPRAIEQTMEGITRVSTLVSAMKDFSHPGTKEKILLDLNHAIQSTITVARNEWRYVAEMEIDFDPSLPFISCQPGEFNQVILNLIVNAAHTIADVVGKEGSEKGKIRVQTHNCPEFVEIRIQDTGTGIPEKERDRIFDPFFTTKEIGKGTGQGLAIARSVVVDKHGGTIHFETEEGKGTTFIIRLPREGKLPAAKAVSA